MRKIFASLMSLFVVSGVFAQIDKGKMQVSDYSKSYYFTTILKEINAYKVVNKSNSQFVMDMSGKTFPTNKSEYRSIWHNKPVSQGRTGCCWCFSTTAMLESDIYRQYNKQVKLSEMYIVYWEYVEKAREYVKTRGTSNFAEGSESNAVMRMMKKYGAVPESAFSGMLQGQKVHDHETLFAEMDTYLKNVKASSAWNETEVLSTIQSILNHYLGTPPTSFDVEGKNYTPATFLSDYLRLKPDDYVDILSYKQQPYNAKVEYEVPDNWWHSKDYYNVDLDMFMHAFKKAVLDGYPVTIGGDVSEGSFSTDLQVAVVPAYDIPSNNIDENARQFRFSNGTTSDDHGMQVVGIKETKDGVWYLIKDSGSGSRNNGEANPNFGYYFFHEDYVKLKMMDFSVHKDAVKDVIKLINE